MLQELKAQREQLQTTIATLKERSANYRKQVEEIDRQLQEECGMTVEEARKFVEENREQLEKQLQTAVETTGQLLQEADRVTRG